MQVVVRVRPALGDEVNAAPAVTCSPSQEQVQVITVSAWPACMHLGISAYQYLLQVELPERLGEKPQLPTHGQGLCFSRLPGWQGIPGKQQGNACALNRPPYLSVCLTC